MMYGLCDCDSFFASCERVFRPELYGKPVVVLSNNDGCIVAMTKEAKSLGLTRGIPFFQAKDIIQQNNVTVFSSNYTLYGDISNRIMQILSEKTGDIDIYSIDEAFFCVDGFNKESLHEELVKLHSFIYKGIGIPVSIGVGPTRTLSKIASHFAKNIPGYKGACIIDSEEKRRKALQLFPVNKVWGIGRHTTKQLNYYGIITAWDFSKRSKSWIQREFKKPGLQTWKELNGIPCKEIEELPEKQSICTSRSFEHMISDYDTLAESVANFTASSALKLRKQHSVCQSLTVFILSNRHREDLEQYYNSKQIRLAVPTDSTMELIQYALSALKLIYKPGVMYKKSGIILTDICSNSCIQQNLFDHTDRQKLNRLTETIDSINNEHGSHKIRFAVQSTSPKHWNLSTEHLSPCYTTDIKDVLMINCHK